MNHCLFKAKDTKGAVGNTVDYSSLTIQVEDEKMIFLDANAFYSYYGRSKLGMTSEPVDEER